MPSITNVTPVLGNNDFCFITGSGFMKSGLQIKRYNAVQSIDHPLSGVSQRRPDLVVEDYIANGTEGVVLTYLYGVALSVNDVTRMNDQMCNCRIQFTAATQAPTFYLVPENTSEGSGAWYLVNQPRIDWIENIKGDKVFYRGHSYRIKGENLKFRTSVSLTSYDPKVYLKPTAGTGLFEITLNQADGVTQDDLYGEEYVYRNIKFDSTVPTGTYNLYYYGRWNKCNIASVSGITLTDYSTPPANNFFTQDHGVSGLRGVNVAPQLQNVFLIAGSSAITTGLTSYVRVAAGDYEIGNTLFIPSGVCVHADGDVHFYNYSPFSITPSATITPHSRLSSYATNSVQSLIKMSEYTEIDGINLVFGHHNYGISYAIQIRPFGVSTNEGNVSIRNCKITSYYNQEAYAIYYYNNVQNVLIENNEFYCKDIIVGNGNSAATNAIKTRWYWFRNQFYGNSGRNSSSRIGKILGKDCIFGLNYITDIERGIVHQDSQGICENNLIFRNTFDKLGDVFNHSENILFETVQARYIGPPSAVGDSTITVPHPKWAAITNMGTASGEAMTRLVCVKNGPGFGQVRYITDNTASGLLYLNEPWIIKPDTTSLISVGIVPYHNAIVGNHLSESLGGIELYGSNISNYIGQNNFYTSMRGVNVYGHGQDVSWYNVLHNNTFKDSQVMIWNNRDINDAAVTGVNIVLGTKLYFNYFGNSPVNIYDVVYSGSLSSSIYGNAACSGLPNSVVGVFMARNFFNSNGWRIAGAKVGNYAPIGIGRHGVSGIYTSTFAGSTVSQITFESIDYAYSTMSKILPRITWVHA